MASRADVVDGIGLPILLRSVEIYAGSGLCVRTLPFAGVLSFHSNRLWTRALLQI